MSSGQTANEEKIGEQVNTNGEHEIESETTASPAPFEQLMAVLVNSGLDMAERTEAADQIVQLALDDVAVAELLAHVFIAANVSSESNRLIAKAIARQPVAPDVLTAPLVDLIERMPEAESIEVIAALGSIRSKAACAALIEYASPDRSVAMRTRAMSALWRQTAMRSLGVDYAAWQAWFVGVSELGAMQWNVLIFGNLARERDQLVNTRSLDIARLVDIATQLNLATPAEQRPALLASYLLDVRAEMRGLGFDLVERELRQSSQLNGEVVQATITLLSHARPSARRRAAQVIDQIAPPDAGPAIALALAVEQDPTVAAELLKACIRWPSAELENPVVRWISAGETTFSPAARAALELHRNGFLVAAPSVEQSLVALRAKAIETLNESSLALLAAIGDDADRTKMAGLLVSEQIPTSRGAALALSDRLEYLDQILLAADGRSHLLSIAAETVLNHRPTAAGYLAIEQLLQVSEDETRDTSWLVRIAGVLSISDLVDVAMQESDRSFRQQLLLRLAADELTVAETDLAFFAQGLAELAQLQTTSGQPESALLTLDKIKNGAGVPADRLVYLRAASLIATNKLDDARLLEPGADAWFDALDNVLALAPDPQLAATIIAELAAKYAASFSDSDRERFALQSAAVDVLVAASGKPDTEGDPPSSEGSGGGSGDG